jgi:hypothetical protein
MRQQLPGIGFEIQRKFFLIGLEIKKSICLLEGHLEVDQSI